MSKVSDRKIRLRIRIKEDGVTTSTVPIFLIAIGCYGHTIFSCEYRRVMSDDCSRYIKKIITSNELCSRDSLCRKKAYHDREHGAN